MPRNDMRPLNLAPGLDLWERQPGESARRFAQFATYRDMGRARTLAKVAETLTRNPGYVRQVASAMRWVDRAEAHDRHRDEMAQRIWLDERRKAAEADARVLDEAITKITDRLATLTSEDLTPGDLVRLLDVTMRHRRTLFGDPHMTVAVTGAHGEPLAVQLAEFAQMGAEQRTAAIGQLAEAVLRRVNAITGSDDDD